MLKYIQVYQFWNYSSWFSFGGFLAQIQDSGCIPLPILGIHMIWHGILKVSNIKWNILQYQKSPWITQTTCNNKHVRHIQKINSFNKIHVKHQNTEMAKKKQKTFFFLFCTNHSGSKILQIFSFKTFCNSSKTFWLLYIYWKPLIVCECGVLFLLPFIVIYTITA